MDVYVCRRDAGGTTNEVHLTIFTDVSRGAKEVGELSAFIRFQRELQETLQIKCIGPTGGERRGAVPQGGAGNPTSQVHWAGSGEGTKGNERAGNTAIRFQRGGAGTTTNEVHWCIGPGVGRG